MDTPNTTTMDTQPIDVELIKRALRTDAERLIGEIDAMYKQIEAFFSHEALGCGGPFSSPIQEHYKSSVHGPANSACRALDMLQSELQSLPACLFMESWSESE